MEPTPSDPKAAKVPAKTVGTESYSLAVFTPYSEIPPTLQEGKAVKDARLGAYSLRNILAAFPENKGVDDDSK